MRILFILQRYPGFGGIETVTKILTDRFMRDYGHHVSIFSTSRQNVPQQLFEDPMFAYLCCEGDQEQVEGAFNRFVEKRKPEIAIYQDSYVDDSRLLEQLPKHVKVIVCEHNTPDALQTGLECVTRDLPLTSLANLWRKLRLPFRMRELWKSCTRHHRKLYEISDRYVLLSDTYREILKKEYGIEGDKLLSIPNPSTVMPDQIEKTYLKEKKNIALFVARITAQKGIKYLLDIWQRVERYSEWELVIVGDGDLMDWLRKSITHLGLRNVRLEGFQTNVSSYFKEASIHLMTSVFEGFAMTNIEAMTYGTIPFAFDSFASVGDIIIDGQCGYVVPSFDTEAYAETIIRFIEMREESKVQMRKNAISRAATFSSDRIALCWNNLFKEMK